MAKKATNYEQQHRSNIERQAAKVDKLFSELSFEAGKIGWAAHNRPEPFSWNKNKALRADAGKVVRGVIKDIEKNIVSAVEVEWALSDSKNDNLAKEILSSQSQILRQYLGHNSAALEAFQKRKIDGLNLSDRLWRLEDKILDELESSIDVSLKTGTSAQQLSRQIRQYLNEPERLFRRVRDERGALQLSKSAKLFHPGQGVYRSSRANALRLARTEINMAYRTADNVRWEDMDFVLGYEVQRSANPYECPICEALKGKYPKEFVFLGWHPNCRCFTTPLLVDADDFIERELLRLAGKEPDPAKAPKRLTMPANFIEYIQKNAESIQKSASNGTTPYYLKLNMAYLKKEEIWSE